MLPFHVLRAGSSGVSATIPTGFFITALGEGPNGFIATYGTSTSYSSSVTTVPNNTIAINSGSGWIATSLPFTSHVLAIANGILNTIVLLTASLIYTSTDGGNTFPNSFGLSSGSSILYADGQYVVQCQSCYTYTSPDGINWTMGTKQKSSFSYVTSTGTYTGTPSFAASGITYVAQTSTFLSAAGVYYNAYALGYAVVLFLSTDGLTWTATVVNTGEGGSAPSSTAASPTLAVIAGTETDSFTYSGTKVGVVMNTTSVGLKSIIYDGSTFYGLSGYNVLSYSTTGSAWTQTTATFGLGAILVTDGTTYYRGYTYSSANGGLTAFTP